MCLKCTQVFKKLNRNKTLLALIHILGKLFEDMLKDTWNGYIQIPLHT